MIHTPSNLSEMQQAHVIITRNYDKIYGYVYEYNRIQL